MRATRRHFSLLLRAMLLLLLKVGKKNEVRTYSSNMAIPSVVIPSLKSSFSFLLLLLFLPFFWGVWFGGVLDMNEIIKKERKKSKKKLSRQLARTVLRERETFFFFG